MSRNPASVLSFGPNPNCWPVFRPLSPATAAGKLIAVNKSVCVVGARALVHLHLDSPQVSRSHALILVEGGRVYLRDLASKNRTYRNGELIREAELYAADMVRFGPFILNCHENFPATPLAAGDDDVPGQEDGPAGELELDASGRRIDLRPRTVLIGRRSQCDVVLTEREISRAHAVLFRREGRQYLRDLNSKNGTFVNGQKAREVVLAEGDQIQIGPHVLRYSLRPHVAEGEAGEAADLMSSGSHLSLADPTGEAPSAVGSTTHSGTLLALTPGAPASPDPADMLSASHYATKDWTGSESGGMASGASPSWMGGSSDGPIVEATPDELLATRDRLPVVGGEAKDDAPWMPADGEPLAPLAEPIDLFGESPSALSGSSADGQNDGGASAVSNPYSLTPWPSDAADPSASPSMADGGQADAAELFAESPAVDDLAPGKPADRDLLMLGEHDLSPDHSGRGNGVKPGANPARPDGQSGGDEQSAADLRARRGTWRDLTAPSGQ